MTHAEFNEVIRLISDCNAALQGQVHSKELQSIMDHAAKRAVIERRTSLYERLERAGLRIDQEV